jgi:hypothetical protein
MTLLKETYPNLIIYKNGRHQYVAELCAVFAFNFIIFMLDPRNGTLEEKFAKVIQHTNKDEDIIELQMKQLNFNMRAIEPIFKKYGHLLSENKIVNKLSTKEKKMFPVPYDNFITGKKYYIYVHKTNTEIEAIFNTYEYDMSIFKVKNKVLCLKHDTTKLQVPFNKLIKDKKYNIISEIVPCNFTGMLHTTACFKHVITKETIFIHMGENRIDVPFSELQENILYEIPIFIEMNFLQYTKDRLFANFISPYPFLHISKNDVKMIVYEYPQMSMPINTHKVRSNSFRVNNSKVSGRSYKEYKTKLTSTANPQMSM